MILLRRFDRIMRVRVDFRQLLERDLRKLTLIQIPNPVIAIEIATALRAGTVTRESPSALMQRPSARPSMYFAGLETR